MCQHRPYLYTNTHSRRAKLLQKLRRILVNSHSFNKLGPEKFLSRTISPRSVLEGSLNGKSTFLVGTYTPRLSWVVLTTFFATAAVFNSALYARYPTYFIWVWCCLVCYLLFHLKVTLIQCSVHRSRTKPTSLTDDCWAGLGWEPQNPFFAEARTTRHTRRANNRHHPSQAKPGPGELPDLVGWMVRDVPTRAYAKLSQGKLHNNS